MTTFLLPGHNQENKEKLADKILKLMALEEIIDTAKSQILEDLEDHNYFSIKWGQLFNDFEVPDREFPDDDRMPTTAIDVPDEISWPKDWKGDHWKRKD